MNGEEEKSICLDCGADLIKKDGELICPYCDVEIDYFGEGEEKEEESVEDLYKEELEEEFPEEKY